MRGGVLAIVLAAVSVLVGAGSAQANSPPSSSWQTNGIVRTITFANGVMYLGGEFSSVRPPGTSAGTGHDVTRHNAAAFNASTGALEPWNPNVNGRVYSLAVSGSRVYIGGEFTTVGGKAHANAAAVSTTTGAVASWTANATGTVYAVRVGPNGNLFLGGAFGAINGTGRKRVAEVSSTGALQAWAPAVAQVPGVPCPPRCKPIVFAIAFSTDGKDVYLGGHFGLVNGAGRNEAAEVPLSSGTTTMAFNPNIYAPANCPTCKTVETSRVYRIIPTSTRIYTCGGYWKVNGTKQSYNVSAFSPTTGILDTGFTGEDDGDTPGCLLRNGVLYIGGHFNVAGKGCTPTALQHCTTRHHVAALNATDGSVIASWNPSANSVHGLLTIAGDASAVGFGGYFTRIGAVDTQGIALYHTLPPP